ncbi:MAG TPA: SulP family inorganic anion transporter [Thermoanaerobaculia bacterium]|nr:SulP family inorganic anion transporter [Thermoanaerobaculia bacterium]
MTETPHPASGHPLPAPRGGGLTSNLSAGATVALVGLPQCLAYALMSGLPPAYGLATAAVAGLVAALVGRSPQVITGPTNTTGLLILSALLPFLGPNGLLRPDAFGVLATLTLLAGAIRIVAALAGGAHLIRLIPESVLIGFTAGVAILIAVMQLDEALGLPPARATSFLGQIAAIMPHIDEVQWPAIAVAVTTAALVGLGRRWQPTAPFALLAILAASFMAWAVRLDAASGLPLVRDRHAMTNGWPPIALPDPSVSLLQSLFIPAMAIVLLGTLELVVTARAGGQRPDMRREILAQGWANVAGAFAGAFPASASLGRSALLRIGGASSRLAPAAAAIITGVVLLMGGNLVGWIPQASLAGVLLVIAVRMIDWKGIRRLWDASHETRLLLVETFAATLLLPLEWAVILGTGTALVIHIANTSAPRLRLLRHEGVALLPVEPGDEPDLVILEVSGNLHYAAVAPFLEEVERIVPSSARAVVIDLSHAHAIRFGALRALEQLAEELAHDGGELWLAGVDPFTARLLKRSGSPLPWVPEEAVPGLSVRKCLSRLGH